MGAGVSLSPTLAGLAVEQERANTDSAAARGLPPEPLRCQSAQAAEAKTVVQYRGGHQGPDSEVTRAARLGMTGPARQLPHLDTIQRAFGSHDLRSVRAFQDEHSTAACASLGARAYASGENVSFAGKSDLHTAAHEAAHVIQQRAGVGFGGELGGSTDPFERHADRVAGLVVAGQSAEGELGRPTAASAHRESSPVQLAPAHGHHGHSHSGGHSKSAKASKQEQPCLNAKDPTACIDDYIKNNPLKGKKNEAQRQFARSPKERYRDALADHAREHAKSRKWVQEGMKDSNPKIRNACEWAWLQDGVRVFPLTDTHDSNKRAKAHGAPKGRGASFSGNHDIKSTTPGDYDFDINSRRNIVCTAGGILIGAKLYVTAVSKEMFLSTLTHEISHLADRVGSQSATPEGIRNYYMTEFRAWYLTPGMKFGSRTKKGAGKFKNERQQKVCEHLVSKYSHIKKAWAADTAETGFRKMAYEFDVDSPGGRGPNLLLSIRIERFIRSLESKAAKSIKAAIAQLKNDEKAYVKENFAEYGQWVDALPHALQALVYTTFGQVVNTPSGLDQPPPGSAK